MGLMKPFEGLIKYFTPRGKILVFGAHFQFTTLEGIFNQIILRFGQHVQ